MIVQNFNLNMIPESNPVIVHVNQYDEGTGRFIVNLYKGNEAYTPSTGATAVIQGTKPDGKGFSYSATISGSMVTANLTKQMSAVAGSVRTQIVITEGDDITGTFAFCMEVQKSGLPADTDMSESEYQLIVQLMEEAQASATSANAAMISARISATSADAAMISAQSSATSANAAMLAAQLSATSADSAMLSAYQSATSADTAMLAAQSSAEDSEAWAVGQRNGVDVESTDPTYQNNSKYYATQAGNSATAAATSEENAEDSEENAEAWAVGTRNGTAVPSTDPTYHHNSKYYAETIGDEAETAEAWAVGTRGGQPVPSTDPTYNNNAKYWSDKSAGQTLGGLSDVDINDPQDGDGIYYDPIAQKWKNGQRGINHFVSIPTVTGFSFTYDGTAQGPTITWQQDESSYIEITNATKTDAGTYTLTIALKNTNTTVWTDLTTASKTYEYTIAKAAGSVTLSANSVTLDNNNLTATVILSNSTGDMTISSSDTTIATVSPASITALSGTITISSVNETTGSATININVAASDNYLAATASVAVSAEFIPTKSFTDASFDEMAEMLAAHYAGTINIADYWAVGQEHEITISAMSATGVGESHVEQTATVVLTNVGDKYLSDGVTECAFQWDLKNNLVEKGYMNSSDTNSGGWKSSARRTWCNDVFYNALPEGFRNCTQQFINQTGLGNSSSSGVENTTDKIALRAEIEIFGSTTQHSVSGEGSQVTYYETSANRIKKLGNSGSANGWWERSPVASYTQYFGYVASSGINGLDRASNTAGLAPFGCL